MFKPYGIIPPIITPFTEDGKFNEPVFRKMVNHLIEEGVHGVFRNYRGVLRFFRGRGSLYLRGLQRRSGGTCSGLCRR